MKLKRHISKAAPTGETYQQRLPEGAFSKYYRDLQQLGRGISAVAEPIRKWEEEKRSLDQANKVQEVTTDMAVALSEAYNEEALNQDHETLVQRYRDRAERLREHFVQDIDDTRVRTFIESNWGQIFIRHMAQMHDLKDKYWRDNTFAKLKGTLTNAARATIEAVDPALANLYIQTALKQVALNQSRGVIGFDKARELQNQFLYDVYVGRLEGLMDENPLEAYKALKRGEFNDYLGIEARFNKQKEALNKYYEGISRANAYAKREIEWEEHFRKEKSRKTLSTYVVMARNGKLTDELIEYAKNKDWLTGREIDFLYGLKDKKDINLIGNREIYEDLEVEIALGFNVKNSVVDAYNADQITGGQAADLINKLDTTRGANNDYKYAVDLISRQFVRGPFDFTTKTVRLMQRTALNEFRERVLEFHEDPILVANEIMDRYLDWRQKRKSGELLPLEIQADPSQIETLYQAGAIGPATYNSWKILLRQIDIATQVKTEEISQRVMGSQNVSK